MSAPDEGAFCAVAMYGLDGGEHDDPAGPAVAAGELLGAGRLPDTHALAHSAARLPRFRAIEPVGAEALPQVAGLDGLTFVSAARATAVLPQRHEAGLVAVRYTVGAGADPAELAVRLRGVLNARPAAPFDAGYGPDFHQVTFVPADAVMALTDANVVSPELQAERWVSVTDGSEVWREDHLVSGSPKDLNRFSSRICAVTPGASMSGGADAVIRLSLSSCRSRRWGASRHCGP